MIEGVSSVSTHDLGWEVGVEQEEAREVESQRYGPKSDSRWSKFDSVICCGSSRWDSLVELCGHRKRILDISLIIFELSFNTDSNRQNWLQ